MSDVNKEEIFNSIRNAQSLHVLKFLGDVLKLHKLYKFPYTDDEEFMQSCRDEYSFNYKALAKQESELEVRQQQQRRIVQEPEEGHGQAPRLHGGSDSGREGVQDLFLDQEE